jgi:uncharacterized membrane protein
LLPIPWTLLLIDLTRFLLVLPIVLLSVSFVVIGIGHFVLHREWTRPVKEDEEER